MLPLPLLVFFFFPSRYLHSSSWQTQSRRQNVSDGWRTEGWAFQQLPSFLEVIFLPFFLMSRKSARFKERLISIFNRRNVPTCGEENDESFCVCACEPLRFGSLSRPPSQANAVDADAYFCSELNMTLLTLYLVLLLMLAHCCGGDNQACRPSAAPRSISARFHSPSLPPPGCVTLFKLRCSAAPACRHY